MEVGTKDLKEHSPLAYELHSRKCTWCPIDHSRYEHIATKLRVSSHIEPLRSIINKTYVTQNCVLHNRVRLGALITGAHKTADVVQAVACDPFMYPDSANQAYIAAVVDRVVRGTTRYVHEHLYTLYVVTMI